MFTRKSQEPREMAVARILHLVLLQLRPFTTSAQSWFLAPLLLCVRLFSRFATPATVLAYLFTRGAPPALGTECVPVEGCPDTCVP